MVVPAPNPTTRRRLANLVFSPVDAQPGIRGGVVIAVFVVHIEDQNRGLTVVHQPGQHDAGQEGFAGAGGAEDAG